VVREIKTAKTPGFFIPAHPVRRQDQSDKILEQRTTNNQALL
jgi:hypothetical protein